MYNSMLNLMKKDLYLLKGDKKLLIILGFFLVSTLFMETSSYFFGYTICIAMYLFLSYTLAYDFKYNGEKLLNSLPIKRSDIVIAKYCFMILMFAGYVILLLIMRLPFLLLTSHIFTASFGMDTIFIAFLLSAVYISIIIPMYFKSGYMNMRWANFGALVSAAIIGNILYFSGFTFRIHYGFLFTLLAFTLLAISVKVSIGIYDRKDI